MKIENNVLVKVTNSDIKDGKFTIPDSVTSIGDFAFYSCTSLTEISIPYSVTSIRNGAFKYCESLTEIKIPDSVTSIGEYAFWNCTSLTEISIPDSVTSIGNSAFYSCTSLTKISIPDSVTSIGEYAFYGCKSLTEISIPDSVTSIGNFVFWNCTNLTEISIPDSVTSIGVYTFYSCTSLTKISIPDSVTSIGDYVFKYCESLTKIFYKNREIKTKCVDGYLMEILSEKSKEDYKIYHCKYFNTEKLCYVVEKENVFSHGESIKEALEDLIYKISDRDTSKYESLTLDSILTFEETIKFYRTITGSCSSGTKHFVENNREKVKESYKISEVIELTKGQFGNEKLLDFFKV